MPDAHERLQPYVVAAHAGDVSGAASLDAEMLAYAKAEVTRLRANNGRRILAEHDYESKIRCQALERLLAARN